MSSRIGIFGAGGHAKEVLTYLRGEDRVKVDFFVDEEWVTEHTRSLLSFDPTQHTMTIAIGDCQLRNLISKKLTEGTQFLSIVSHHALVCCESVQIGTGSMLGHFCVLTQDIRIGKHAIINNHVSIHHGARIGDFFTASPGAIVLGNVQLGNRVFLGAGAVCRDKISICSDVIIGAGSVVTQDINESGVYVGVPARRIG
jgi:sugar O-acyltransferase (sialic acid O-acetyltransferase NeuD family)